MPAKVLRGLDYKQEQNPERLLRDTRSFGQKLADFFKTPTAVAISICMAAVAAFVIPALADIVLIGGAICFLIARGTKPVLPFRMPQRSNLIDHNDPQPGTGKARKARGIYFLGNDERSGEELWFANEDMRTHMLIFGSTGSGKTEALVSIAYNALVQGSGFIYVDGKGDNSLFAKVFSMVRSMGREDDLLLINFMTGARDIIGPQKNRLSNTLNPFSSGSSSMLSQLVVSLMDAGSESSDGDMWKGRAIAFVEALMKILVAMRDDGHILLDANTIRNYFILERIEAMVLDKQFIRDDKDPVNIEYLAPIIVEPIKNYLINLPGYNKEKKGKQVSQVLEQHGFITMQLTRVFSSLADAYGHILRTKLAEVDLKDVVLNRRILVVLLPALEKSPDELSNLGKVIIASLKAMMASGLGDEVEGDYRDLIQKKPTNAKTPYLCILDEYGYYAVEGFAVVPAQARSLGFSVVFAGQDLPAFQKASKEEAASIGANTNIKICMKLEDPLETWDFFQKTAGESYVSFAKEFQADSKTVTNMYQDSKSAQIDKWQRIHLLDLKDQREGEAHIFFRSRIVRARMFYANPTPVKSMRLNQFLKVDAPDDAIILKHKKGLKKFEAILNEGDIFVNVATDDQLSELATKMSAKTESLPIERGIAALMDLHKKAVTEDEEIEPIDIDLDDDELNIFKPLGETEYLDKLLIRNHSANLTNAIIDQEVLQEKTLMIERLMGNNDRKSSQISRAIIKDMQTATHYPPNIEDMPTEDDLAGLIDSLAGHVNQTKEEKSKDKEVD